MKRPKQPSPYEEKSDPMRDLDIELEGADDDVIDLEDIIEMPESPIDEDEDLDLDVEIFDVDSDLESGTEKAAKPAMKEQPPGMSSEAEDLIKSFGDEPDEEEVLFEQPASKGPEKPPLGKEDEPQFFDEEEELLLDDSMDKPAVHKSGLVSDEIAGSKDKDTGELTVTEEAPAADLEPEALLSDESLASIAADSASARVPSSADISQTAEELVARIETSLQEHIRALVESRLPDIVRSIISEEVEKLRKELE